MRSDGPLTEKGKRLDYHHFNALQRDRKYFKGWSDGLEKLRRILRGILRLALPHSNLRFINSSMTGFLGGEDAITP